MKKINLKKIAPIGVIIIIFIIGALIVSSTVNKELETQSAPASLSLENQQIGYDINETLEALMGVHYVSIIDKKSDDPNAVIIDELTESMQDLDKLEKIAYNTSILVESNDETISGVNRIINMSVLSLSISYGDWIEYLRTVNMETVDVSEFQYQLALFQSSTHDSFLTLIEGASYLPFVVMNFSEVEGEDATIDEELKEYFLGTLDRLFTDILEEDEQFKIETDTNLAIPILVRGYYEFFLPEN